MAALRPLVVSLAFALAAASMATAANQDVLAELEARTRAWQAANPGSLPHWLTPDELGRLDEIGRTFTETPPPALPPRSIAEFERQAAVLVRYPFGVSLALIAALSVETPVLTLVSGPSQENTVRAQYTSAGVNLANCSFLHASTNSYWTRDYGPMFAQTGDEVAVVDFPYNRPRPLDDDVPWRVAAHLGLDCYGMNLVHTGGNWMSDGYGAAASSDLVVTENPGLTIQQIGQRVLDYLGVERYHTLPDPNNTYIDHIDCWGKFLDVDKVLIREVPASHAQYDEIEATAAWFAAATSSWGTPYQIYRVWTPNNQPYTNSLILNGRVFVPIMNSTWDAAALAVYQAALPGFEVLGFTGSWESTDALHCRAIGLADPGLLRIHHLPLADTLVAGQPRELRATITACSGQALIVDSLRCWHRVDGGPWTALALQADGAEWRTWLPALAAGQELEYCLQAADLSGRFEQHPFTGRADPHHATAVATALASPLLAVELVAGQVQLSWEPVPGAARYLVEGAAGLAQPWTLLAQTVETSWSEAALPGWTRLYRVKAVTP
ncbi:MAG: agmatine deiminase family protein [bacterium]|jgi:agmatine/peptidylarginine deiminase|nr:agmatine deiminase family protein [bacterium]